MVVCEWRLVAAKKGVPLRGKHNLSGWHFLILSNFSSIEICK